ncbi:predicted protein [Aspergillus terreus NIH2624]|uniref:Uncharacterized protein n=1 Tax=Aspergillus terreus (strain NIH 2624 / FGSC A1156) TaxID=341663 RepID=Q0CQD1_ASPTN|nr:uncharacterized protein ATEG_04103 [Aspergillus terreus NIH2624]EAU35905.1 predicted protein [Aspergillus terreus NIH2624]
MSQFQLFPTTSPQSKGSKNPFRKEKRPQAASPKPSGSTRGSKRGSPRTEAVLVHVFEETNHVKPPPQAHIPGSASVSSPETPESRTWSSPQGNGSERWDSPVTEVSKSPLSADSHKAAAHNTHQSSSSPVIPMKSIFPRYDPNVPLSQQKYYPQLPNSPQGRRPRALTLSPQPEIDRTLGPKTVPASVMDFPTDVLDQVEVRYSSTEELKDLWEAANGQRPKDLAETYNLRVARTDSSTFTFGDPNAPFYTMQTHPTDELSIKRANPSTLKSSVPIMTLKLEDRRRRDPPNDGLVTQLFSRLAAMLAIDQAEELARRHLLDFAEAAEVEGNALKRAAAQESCKLTWNYTRRLYELRHPSLSKAHRQQPALVGAAGIPLSPVRSNYAGLLHISVSTPSTDVTSSAQQQPPTILVTTPLPANAVETAHAAATPRTSTLPLMDSDEPLAALDLASMTLTISAAAITATIPSLYAIDSLVSAVMAVAIADDTARPFLLNMDLYNPCEHQAPYVVGGGKRFTGKLVATLAEREDAEQGTELASKIKSERAERGERGLSWFRSFGRKKSEPARKGKTKKIVVEEFDLERYGRYGSSSSRDGEKLPGATRGVLRVLFWGLNMVVHALTLMVKIPGLGIG